MQSIILGFCVYTSWDQLCFAMANSKGPSSVRNMIYNGKSSFLPPKSPFPSISPSYIDYVPSSVVTQKDNSKPRNGSHHQRTSSESCLIEEQPSWLDDLLNEPETPVRRGGHRRSSSDSFTYFDAANIANLDYIAQDDNKFRNLTHVPSWGSQDFDYYKNTQHATFHVDQNSSNRQKSRARDASSNAIPHPRGLSPFIENAKSHSLAPSCPPQEGERPKSAGSDKQDLVESGPPDPKGSGERKDSSHSKNSASETDTKRAKQQFAQRSRVRKLQYISELERNVQVLQADGCEVSAELEFLNQQNLILSMENKALKQRLENLAQEQLIKYWQNMRSTRGRPSSSNDPSKGEEKKPMVKPFNIRPSMESPNKFSALTCLPLINSGLTINPFPTLPSPSASSSRPLAAPKPLILKKTLYKGFRTLFLLPFWRTPIFLGTNQR